MFCHDCNSSPCKAFLYKEGLQAEFNSLSSLLAPSHKRNHLYRKFVVGEHGTLGRHVRVRVPECVIKFIRELCPEPSGTYTGHRDVDSEGEEEVGNDESFEGVLPQGNLGTINFDGGMKIKVCVSFENTVYPISHIRKFINESNVFGWTVSFVGDEFTNATIVCETEASWNEVFFYCLNKVEEVSEVVYDKVYG